jgi:hypothetical protein
MSIEQFLSDLYWPISSQIFDTWFTQLAACFCWFLAWLILQQWRRRQNVLLKCQAVSKLHGVTTQKAVLFMVTAMRNANPIFGLFSVSDLLTMLCSVLIYITVSLSCKKWKYTIAKIRPLISRVSEYQAQSLLKISAL